VPSNLSSKPKAHSPLPIERQAMALRVGDTYRVTIDIAKASEGARTRQDIRINRTVTSRNAAKLREISPRRQT